jgi:hypothetical protein
MSEKSPQLPPGQSPAERLNAKLAQAKVADEAEKSKAAELTEQLAKALAEQEKKNALRNLQAEFSALWSEMEQLISAVSEDDIKHADFYLKEIAAQSAEVDEYSATVDAESRGLADLEEVLDNIKSTEGLDTDTKSGLVKQAEQALRAQQRVILDAKNRVNSLRKVIEELEAKLSVATDIESRFSGSGKTLQDKLEGIKLQMKEIDPDARPEEILELESKIAQEAERDQQQKIAQGVERERRITISKLLFEEARRDTARRITWRLEEMFQKSRPGSSLRDANGYPVSPENVSQRINSGADRLLAELTNHPENFINITRPELVQDRIQRSRSLFVDLEKAEQLIQAKLAVWSLFGKDRLRNQLAKIQEFKERVGLNIQRLNVIDKEGKELHSRLTSHDKIFKEYSHAAETVKGQLTRSEQVEVFDGNTTVKKSVIDDEFLSTVIPALSPEAFAISTRNVEFIHGAAILEAFEKAVPNINPEIYEYLRTIQVIK